MLCTALSFDYSLFTMTRYGEERRKGASLEDSIAAWQRQGNSMVQHCEKPIQSGVWQTLASRLMVLIYPLSFDLSLFIIIYLYLIYISFFLWDLISILMGFQDVRGNCDHTKRSRGPGVGLGAHHCLWLNAMSSRLECLGRSSGRKPGKKREPSEDRQLLVQLLKAMLTIN